MTDEVIVEVGFKLDKKLSYYDKILKRHGLRVLFKCVTHDVYYTKCNSFEGFTENQIKTSCIRIRNPKRGDKKKELELISAGYYKVFDTIKRDFHYYKEGMGSRVQMQVIKDVGLVVYYDNPMYYKFAEEEQREKLIDELNSYGFEFKYSDLGIDKLRTLYYKKELFSKNQNK